MLIVFGIMASVFDLRAFLNSENALANLLTIVIIFLILAALAKSETYHQEHISKIFRHISDQQFLKLVLNTHESGLVVLNENC